MKLYILSLLLISACNSSPEGRDITGPEQDAVIEEQNRKQACLMTSNGNAEYIACVKPIKPKEE